MVLSIISLLLVFRLLGELLLSKLNQQELHRYENKAPEAVACIMDEASYAKSVAYSKSKLSFGLLTECLDTALLFAWLLSGVLPWIYSLTKPLSASGTWNEALFLIAVALLMGLPSLPFEWWAQFRLEAKFGFNNSSLGLWIADKLKGTVVSLIIGFPLLWGVLSLVNWVGASWWIFACLLLFGFQVLMIILYPKLIVPLFNKLSPLSEGPLKERLMALAKKTGFKAHTIEVIDGSKRSGHSNAYFTGFGRFRRIVLYDTLIQQLQEDEIEAVLAHEIGHYRCGHIPRMIALSAVMMLGAFAVIAWLSQASWFNTAFGFEAGALAPSFLLFALLSSTITFWLSPLGNILSRKHEYQADAFAKNAMGSAEPLVNALRKLAKKNLVNMTPHPLYSGFHYSHPTLVERERALRQ